MGDVDVLRPEFARHRLRDGAQPEFRAGKRRIAGAPRRLAVAPVKKMEPRSRGSIRRAASRPVRKPE